MRCAFPWDEASGEGDTCKFTEKGAASAREDGRGFTFAQANRY